MVSDLRIYVVIGLFMIICISLLIFNFTVIGYARGEHARAAHRIEKWKNLLYKQTVMMDGAGARASKHERFLLRKLVNAENLIVYAQALQYLKSEFPEAYNEYVHRSFDTFQKLAVLYGRKPRVERTCYADFIGTFPEVAGDTHGELVNVLISYIDDSNIHCRMKVFRALCSIGTIQGVVHVLQLIHDRSLFMHSQLLAKELSNFNGDQELLGERLWDESRSWNDNLTVSVIQFITRVSNRYGERFLPILRDASANTEVCIAIVRYYREHIYEPAIPILIEFITKPIDMNLAVEAKSALALYPVSDIATAESEHALSSSGRYTRSPQHPDSPLLAI